MSHPKVFYNPSTRRSTEEVLTDLQKRTPTSGINYSKIIKDLKYPFTLFLL